MDTLAADLTEVQLNLGHMVATALGQNVDAVAFRHRGRVLTRGDLLRNAQAHAAQLRARGIQSGEPVVVEIEHGFVLVEAICAVLLAGGAVVPLDPSLSRARRSAIHADITPRLVVSRARSADRIDIADTGQSVRPVRDLALVVYTSGSSGVPKGVEITHAGYCGRLTEIINAFRPDPETVDLMWTPSSFVGMLDEIFFPLFQHTPSVIADPNLRNTPRQLAQLVQDERVSVLRLTPSLLTLLLRAGVDAQLQGLRTIYCAGETLTADVQNATHAQLNAQIIGFYGASEAPGVAYQVFERTGAASETTLCRPQSFASFRVMDPQGAPVGGAQTGELWVGGVALASGYRGKPELTADKFVQYDGQRWYRTGDLGRALADGRIEVLGRADMSEVNINGVRVNLADLRHELRLLPEISDAWVSAVAPHDAPDRVSLVAHYVREESTLVPDQTLRQKLERHPELKTLPVVFTARPGLPLTDNGKIDMRCLEREARQCVESGKTAPPRVTPGGEISEKAAIVLPAVCAVAAEILQRDVVAPEDNFFALQGNSLLAVHYALALGDVLNTYISSGLVFTSESFAALAQAISEGEGLHSHPVLTLRKGDRGTSLVTINATGRYTALAARLDGAYPIHNLNIFGMTNRSGCETGALTLASLGAQMAAQLCETDASGRYKLLAYCQDGPLAIEIARALQRDHSASCHLLLIDTFFSRHAVSAGMVLGRVLDLGPGYYVSKLCRRITARKRRLETEDMSSAQKVASLAKVEKDRQLYRHYTTLFTSYEPARFDGAFTLIVSKEWQRADLSDVRRVAGPEIDIRVVDGLHSEIFQDRFIHRIAQEIDREMRS